MKSIVKQNHQFTLNLKRLMNHYSITTSELANMFDSTEERIQACIELRDNFTLDELLVFTIMFSISLEDLMLHKNVLKLRAYQQDLLPNLKTRHELEDLHRQLLTQLVMYEYTSKELNQIVRRAKDFYKSVLKVENDEQEEIEEIEEIIEKEDESE